MVKEVAAGFCIFRRLSNQIEYLLLQASYGTRHWTPPKGNFVLQPEHEKFRGNPIIPEFQDIWRMVKQSLKQH